MSAYLVILGQRDAIRWVLTEQLMAFPATPRAEVRALAPRDRLFLYATRGAWGNPTRDRGRIIATATTKTAVRGLDAPIEIAGRAFVSGCSLTIDGSFPTRAASNSSRSSANWTRSPSQTPRASISAVPCFAFLRRMWRSSTNS